jgi:hypothetical protein
LTSLGVLSDRRKEPRSGRSHDRNIKSDSKTSIKIDENASVESKRRKSRGPLTPKTHTITNDIKSQD